MIYRCIVCPFSRSYLLQFKYCFVMMTQILFISRIQNSKDDLLIVTQHSNSLNLNSQLSPSIHLPLY